MGTNRPEFLLKSPEGEIIFEVASVSTKPDDLRDGVKVSTRGILKKALQNKVREKFGGCKSKFSTPVVIAVETQSDDFDVTNSLYGPLQYTFTQKKESREIVAEGATRDEEKAFFNLDYVECISAIVVIFPANGNSPYLQGRIYRPLKPVKNPIRPKLWVRLRSSLFGPVPQSLLNEFARIPGIKKEEAELLLANGVDDVSFFASGSIDLPDDMKMEPARFRELQKEAGRLLLINQTGQIAYLLSARGADLRPFWEHRIFTISRLLQLKERPSGITDELWNSMRSEASTFLERRDSV